MIIVEKYSDELEKEIESLPYPSTPLRDMIFIPESDYGFAEIYRIYDDILVFLIPQYGGTPSFHRCYKRHTIKNLVEELRKMC
jgi:hypothetical protein